MSKIRDWIMGRQVKSLEETRDKLEAKVEHLRFEVGQMEDEKDGMREQIHTLDRTVVDLKEQAEKQKRLKKLEDDEIKHRLKVREEELDLDTKKKLMERDEKHAKALADAERSYQEKITEGLEKRVGEMKEMYGQILERLPDVNYRIRDSREA